MVSANRFPPPATRSEMLIEPTKPERLEATSEGTARIARQIEGLYQVGEEVLGEMVLVVARRFVSRLLGSAEIASCRRPHHRDLMAELSAVTEAVASDTRAPGRE